MKFFVPADREAAHAEMAEWLRDREIRVTDDRIYRLRYMHKRKIYSATVGQPADVNGETVMAIYALASGSYAICTATRGWNRINVPIYTGNEGDGDERGDKILEMEGFET